MLGTVSIIRVGNIPLTRTRIGYNTADPSIVQTEMGKGGGRVTGHGMQVEAKQCDHHEIDD